MLISCKKENRISTVEPDTLLSVLWNQEPSSALFYQWFEKLQTDSWKRSVQAEPDSIFKSVYNYPSGFNEVDSLAFSSLGKDQSYLDHFTAKKFFFLDSLTISDEPIYPFVIPAGPFNILSIRDPNLEGLTNLYFINQEKMLGGIITIHRSSLHYLIRPENDTSVLFGYVFDFGSGNGMIWDQFFLYRVTSSGIQPLFQFPLQVNEAIPDNYARLKNYESTLVDSVRFIFQTRISSSVWTADSTLLLPDISMISGPQLKHPLPVPELYHTYFSPYTDLLFIHAFRKQLLSAYLKMNLTERRIFRTYLHTLISQQLSPENT